MIGTKLVLLDEPFQGLAPALAHRYSDVLREVRDKNPETTLIVTESSPDLLRGFGDMVFQIERGEVSLVNKKQEG
jgi:branched-chain amino acid transport system ATP-binding protein